jgi:integrase
VKRCFGAVHVTGHQQSFGKVCQIEGTADIASNNPREKGTAEVLPLSALALKVINEQPKVVGNEYVFAAPRGRPFCNWSNCKTGMDSELPADMPRWTVHDLRRTARTRLSKCKVPTEVSERILGHSLKGMAQIYNRDEMLEQMAIAMDKLSARIQSIVDPENNVLPLRAA